MNYILSNCCPGSKKSRLNLTVCLLFFSRNGKDCRIVYLDGPPAFEKSGPVFGAAWNLPLKEARPMAQVNHFFSLLRNAHCYHSFNCRTQPLTCSMLPHLWGPEVTKTITWSVPEVDANLIHQIHLQPS